MTSVGSQSESPRPAIASPKMDPLEGYDRVYAYDPFGNRIELMQPVT